jgi:hypothetical protein
MNSLDVRKEYACARPFSRALQLDSFQQPAKNILFTEKGHLIPRGQSSNASWIINNRVVESWSNVKDPTLQFSSTPTLHSSTEILIADEFLDSGDDLRRLHDYFFRQTFQLLAANQLRLKTFLLRFGNEIRMIHRLGISRA